MSGDAAIAYYEGGTELTGVVLEALRTAGRIGLVMAVFSKRS